MKNTNSNQVSDKANQPSTAIPVKVEGNVLHDRETLLVITKELENRNKGLDDLKGITSAAQGYAFTLLRSTYADEPGGNTAEEQFSKVVVSSGFAKRTVERRMQLAAGMIKGGILKPRTLVLIEDAVTKGEQIPDEALNQIGEKVGKGKTQTDLYRQFGILPPLANEKLDATKVKSVKEKIESTIEKLTKQLGTLINGKPFEKEVKDDAIVEGYRTQLQQLRTVCGKFKTITLVEIAATPPATEQETAAVSTELRKINKENIELKKQLIDVEERAVALTEA